VQIDTLTVSWAIQRLSGISTPANSAYSLSDVVHQFKSAGAMCIFTNVPLLDVTLQAAKEIGIPRNRVYLINAPEKLLEGKQVPTEFKTVDQLIAEGQKQGTLEKQNFTKGQGKNQVAFLCYSSGTSGLPVSSVVASFGARD
jgi:long-subunit acyl-CoA synthetase (AMP-forming)